MSDIEFVNGLIVKAPKSGAPDYIKASISIKRDDLLDWLGDRDGDWINIVVKESKGGKWYCAVDTWKPNSDSQSDRPQRQESKLAREASFADAPAPSFADDEIPFAPIPRRQLW